MKPEASFTFSLLSLLCFIFWSYAVLHVPGVTQFDSSVYSLMSHYANPTWVLLNRYITFLGNGEFLFPFALIIVFFLWKRGFVSASIWYFISLSVGAQTNAALKVFFGQPRPESFDPTYFLKSFSYPSGHASGAMIFYLMTFWVLSRMWPKTFKRITSLTVACILIFAIGLTRVALGVHWFSDVLGGFLFGLFWVFLNLMIAVRFKLFPQEKI